MSSLFFNIIDILISCAYIVSATFVFAKMGKGGSKMSMICLYAWACLMLFAYICYMFAEMMWEWDINIISTACYVDISESGVVDITNFIAQIPLIAFLVMRLIKTSTYKLPLMVGIAGVVVKLISILACCFWHGLGMSSMPQVGWTHPLLHFIHYGYAILMATSFILMFFASRRLGKRAK